MVTYFEIYRLIIFNSEFHFFLLFLLSTLQIMNRTKNSSLSYKTGWNLIKDQ